MKWIAIGLNFFLLGFCIWLTVKHGVPQSGGDLVFMLLLYLTPITTLGVFLFGGESWLGLYLKRKALEEKQRIAKLERDSRP